MSKNTRARHIVRGFSMRPNQVEWGIAQCALVWVVKGKSFRNATPEEAIRMRNAQAAGRGIEWAELPGVVYEPQPALVAGYRRERELAAAAGRWNFLRNASCYLAAQVAPDWPCGFTPGNLEARALLFEAQLALLRADGVAREQPGRTMLCALSQERLVA